MVVKVFNTILYGAIFLSLFIVDYLLGNGLVDMSQKIFCKITCFVRRTLKEEAKKVAIAGIDNPINLTVLCTEIVVLSVTIAILNKYKKLRGNDRIDELLQESKEALKQTNEFLEKWRLRRINWQVPTEYSYLDDEPQEIEPLKLEVPILHMAIVDTLGTTRSQPERGDAGDTINMTDSTLLSITSLVEDDYVSITEPASEEKMEDVPKNIEFRNRYLWDVMEEDANVAKD
ncbi:hypothetical protein K1T71_012333 [Dendrolimus kikuchii]|uniref:Uncharacterized protein n=1 Tax=Dendrolimus kikuchii TaxID=765133 RepID=A0ACC1CLI1_9NEOP|nr:hypothetical protein K1T71_012333 [Dendrolimus kikuchii]